MENNRKWLYLIVQILLAVLTLVLSVLKPVTYPTVHCDGGLTAALITGGISLLNSISNNIAARRATKEQNEYNAPFSQMRRYQAAGLNPNLIYGTGQASAGNQSSPASYQGFHTSTQDALNMANAILSLKNMDANTRKAVAEANQAEAAALGSNLDNEQKSIYLNEYNERLQQELINARLAAAYKSGEITLQEYQKAVLAAQASELNQKVAESKYKVQNYLPTMLAINQMNARTAEQNMLLGYNRLAWDQNEWNPSNILSKSRTQEIMEAISRLPSKAQMRFKEGIELGGNFVRSLAPWATRTYSGSTTRGGYQSWSADYIY